MDITEPYVISLDIGGTKTDAALVRAGAILTRVQVPTRPSFDGVLTSAMEAITSIQERSGITSEQIAAIGAGIPGQVENGEVMYAVNLGINDGPVPFAHKLSEISGLPVHLENDLTTATYGALLAHDAADSAVFISIGTGLAAGVATAGKVVRGFGRMAGEIGHLVRDPHGPLCKCGQRGCYELYVSGSALTRQWLAVDPHAASLNASTPIPRQIFAAACASTHPHHHQGAAIRNDFIAGLAELIHIVALTTDPEHILIGGGVSTLGSELANPLLATLKESETTSPFLARVGLSARVEIVPPDMGAALIGAAHLASAHLVHSIGEPL